jgi:hypothetical protein
MALTAENSDGGAFSDNADGGMSWITHRYVTNTIKRNAKAPKINCFIMITTSPSLRGKSGIAIRNSHRFFF